MKSDSECQAQLKAGDIPTPTVATPRTHRPPRAKLSAMIFRCGVALVVSLGSFPTAINFDRSGTMRIGKYILNHSFMLPGLISTAVAVMAGLAIAQLAF